MFGFNEFSKKRVKSFNRGKTWRKFWKGLQRKDCSSRTRCLSQDVFGLFCQLWEMQVCLICAGSFTAEGAEKGWVAPPWLTKRDHALNRVTSFPSLKWSEWGGSKVGCLSFLGLSISILPFLSNIIQQRVTPGKSLLRMGQFLSFTRPAIPLVYVFWLLAHSCIWMGCEWIDLSRGEEVEPLSAKPIAVPVSQCTPSELLVGLLISFGHPVITFSAFHLGGLCLTISVILPSSKSPLP